MKVTRIWIYPNNKPENAITKDVIEGEDNLLRQMLNTFMKSLERQKINYIFEIEDKEGKHLRYNLDKKDFEIAQKYLPNLK